MVNGSRGIDNGMRGFGVDWGTTGTRRTNGVGQGSRGAGEPALGGLAFFRAVGELVGCVQS